jgi:hypothetical protein
MSELEEPNGKSQIAKPLVHSKNTSSIIKSTYT